MDREISGRIWMARAAFATAVGVIGVKVKVNWISSLISRLMMEFNWHTFRFLSFRIHRKTSAVIIFNNSFKTVTPSNRLLTQLPQGLKKYLGNFG